MILSSEAQGVGQWLGTSAWTLHDLRATLLHTMKIPRDQVDEYLRKGLRDLVVQRLISWAFEPEYGDRPSESPPASTTEFFDRDWQRCVSSGSLRECVPDAENPTMLIEGSDELVKAFDEVGGV